MEKMMKFKYELILINNDNFPLERLNKLGEEGYEVIEQIEYKDKIHGPIHQKALLLMKEANGRIPA